MLLLRQLVPWLPVLLVSVVTCVEVGVNYPISAGDQAWLDSLFYLPPEPRVRVEYRMLTRQQRDQFHNAYLAMANDTVSLSW